MRIRRIVTAMLVAALVPAFALACGNDPALLAIENLTDGELAVEITKFPDDQPLDPGDTRVATVPYDTMYQTELVEITNDSSARIRVTGPGDQILCEHVATESEPAPRLVVGSDGCAVESGASE